MITLELCAPAYPKAVRLSRWATLNGRTRCRALACAAILAIFVLSTNMQTAQAAEGDLDPTFGTGGVVTTDLGTSRDIALAIARQSDGRLVVAGSAGNFGAEDFALARYNLDGTLDTGFGTGGVVITDFAGRDDEAQGVALQADGKIVVVGTSGNDFTIARYNADGTLDTTFGSGGKITTDLGATEGAFAVIIQPDGKIVVAGRTVAFASFLVLLRYNADGSQDTGFGTDGNGIVVSAALGSALAMALDQDGNIVVAGQLNLDFGVARFTPAGVLDMTFGFNGVNHVDFAGLNDVPRSLAFQDGKIVVAGSAGTFGGGGFGLARFNADGTLDTTFGTGGKVVTDIVDTAYLIQATGIAVQPDGKIVVVGQGFGPPFFNPSFIVARYNTDGSLDETFGSGGIVAAPADNGYSYAMVLQPDGNIVAAGHLSPTGNHDFALARYIGTPTLSVITVAATDPSATEAGPDLGVFTFTRSGDTTNALTVHFTVGGTATEGADYNSIGTSVTIPAGQATATVTITPVLDVFIEGNDTVTVTLAAGTGYTVGTPNTATVTIVNYTGGILRGQSQVNFGTVRVGSSASRTLTIANGSLTETLIVTVNSSTPNPPFSLVSGGGTTVIGPGLSFQVVLRFSPTGPGDAMGTLLINSTDLARPTVSIGLVGKAK